MSLRTRITALATTVGQLMKLHLNAIDSLESDKIPVALADGATINIDAALSTKFSVTLGGNRTIAAPTNATNGRQMLLRLTQDGTGSRTLTWNAAFFFPSGTPPVLSTAAGKVDYVGFIYNSTTVKWEMLAYKKGS